MKSLKQVFIMAVSLLVSATSDAQKKVKTSFEQIKEKCKDVPKEKRLTITVARFNVTTPNTGGEFGDNMATMLSNALQQVDCYIVLSMQKNKSDVNSEIDFGETGYANKKTAIQKGNQLSAQVVATGEVTEFNKHTKSIGVGIYKHKAEIVKLGFIIQLINPETRVIMDSRSVNVEGKSGGSMELGVGIPLVGRLNFGGSSSNSPAVADALEQGIIKAVEAIADMKEKNNIVPVGMAASGNNTTITVSNISYETLEEFGSILKGIPKVKSAEPSFDESIAKFDIVHEGSTNELLEELKKKLGTKYKITGMKEGEIKMIAN